MVYAGNYIFRENTGEADMGKIIKNREKAYEGSRLQFVRALWHSNFSSTGYVIYSRDFKILAEKNMLIDSARQKYIQVDKNMYITNKNNPRASTNLKVNNGSAFINKDGYYAAGGLEWKGDMGNQRVGDMLPYEFQSEKDPKENAAIQN